MTHGLMFALLTMSWQPATARANPVVPASFNVRDFGAKGDGVADDTPAIRAAFAAAAKTTISIPTPGTAHHYSQNNVYFPNGRYRLTEALLPTANMVGEGNALKDVHRSRRMHNDAVVPWRPDKHQHKTVGSFLRSLGLSLPSCCRIVIKRFLDNSRSRL